MSTGGKLCYRLWQPTLKTLITYRLKEHIQWWIKAKAPKPVFELLQQGVLPNWPEPMLYIFPCHRSAVEESQALVLMAGYMECGALSLLSSQTLILDPTRFLIPWFLILTQEKSRFFCDCKVLNKHLTPLHFRLDNGGDIFPFLRRGMWGEGRLKTCLISPPKLPKTKTIYEGKDFSSSNLQCLD